MRAAPLVVLLLSLLLAAPAAAHELGADHSDWRGELAFTDVGGTVETVERGAGAEDEGLPTAWCGAERTTLRATRGIFSALTAKRPSAGLLLGP